MLFVTLINSFIDSVTNKLRILKSSLPVIEHNGARNSRETSLETRDNVQYSKSEKKQKQGFESIDVLQRSANQVKTAFT